MRTAITTLLFLVISGISHAQSAQASSANGYYTYIPYRGNDPFVFCTEGVPEHCWAPVSPVLGTYTVTNQYCFNAASASLYAQVCPRAMGQGAWVGSGTGSMVPFMH